MIRRYEERDYEAVVYLLEVCGLPACDIRELEGYGLIWEEQGQPVGFVWALINEGASVYIDHFCVHPDFRRKDPETGRSEIGFWLMFAMLTNLKAMGKTRITGDLQKDFGGRAFMAIYGSVGMKFQQPEAFIYGNIGEIIKNVESQHGTRE